MKVSALFLLLTLPLFCFSQNDDETSDGYSTANDYIFKIAKNYFHPNPYETDFGSFLKHLLNDPGLINKTTHKKTDSSLFSFQAQYKNYSPFGFLADRTEVKLLEREIVFDSSLSQKDTLFIYQLFGFAFNGDAGLKAVKNEYSKFTHHYGKHFNTETSEIKKGDAVVGERQDYYVTGFPVSPITVGWAKFDEYQNAFILTVRFKPQ